MTGRARHVREPGDDRSAGIGVRAEPTGPSGWVCTVTVAGPRGRRRHLVRVSPGERARYGPHTSVEELVRRSVEFLLAREAPSAILATFDLGAIQRYFPEYEAEIRGPVE